jgi:hypothetical protein
MVLSRGLLAGFLALFFLFKRLIDQLRPLAIKKNGVNYKSSSLVVNSELKLSTISDSNKKKIFSLT